MTELLLGDHISVHAQLRASYEALRVKTDDQVSERYAATLGVPAMPCCKRERRIDGDEII